MTELPRIDNFMTTDIKFLKPDMSIHAAIKILIDNGISGAPVVDEGGDLVGILSKKDCLKVAFSDSYHQNVGGQVSDYMSVDVETVDVGTSLIDMAERFLGGTYHRFPVIRNGRLAGLISRHDILKAIEEQWSVIGQQKEL